MNGFRALLMTTVTGALVGCEPAAVTPASAPRVDAIEGTPSIAAGGSGHLTSGGEQRTFAFHARRRPNGTTEGQFQFQNRALDATVHGEVICVTTFANNAWIGGRVTSGDAPEGETLWRVRDNGEGSNAAPDQISLMFVGQPVGTAERYCRLRPISPPLLAIEEGNVQVHPTADVSGAFTGLWAGVRFTPSGGICCA